MSQIVEYFKGGSLSSTKLMMSNDKKLFVRKTVSLLENREYGFQRWYSQLKKIQRYSVLFPNVFPNILEFGKNEEMAYFDMEYYEDSINAYEFIKNSKDAYEIDSFFNELMQVMQQLYLMKINSNPESIDLYIYEEVEQKLKDCNKNKSFTDFLIYDELIFNGTKVSSFLKVLNEYKIIAKKYHTNAIEVFTHGNITLENILYLPKENKIILIDPYEENIIDSIYAEYSQLLQSTNSKYEIYNSEDSIVIDNSITLKVVESYGINYLNNKINSYLKSNYSHDDYIMIKIFEISQFIRMLPFKMEVDENKMIFFYGLASYLFDKLKKEELIDE